MGTLEVIKHQVEAGASGSLRQREAQLDARDRQLTAQLAAARDAEAANDAKVRLAVQFIIDTSIARSRDWWA